MVPTDLPSTPDAYTLNISYSGDSNYSSTSATSIGTITVAAPASNKPLDLAPIDGQGSLPTPAGDGIAANAAMSSTGVVYGDGEFVTSRTDLTSNGFGTPWGEGWSWSSLGGDYGDGISGGNQTQAPHLVNINSQTSIAVVDGASAYFMDLYGGSFHTRFGLDVVLTHNTGSGTYVLNLVAINGRANALNSLAPL